MVWGFCKPDAVFRRKSVVLRDEVEFYVTDRYSISLAATHFGERFDDAAKAQYFLEIEHRIGIVQNDVAAEHVHKPANDHVHALFVFEDFKAEIVVRFILEFFLDGNGFHGGQGCEHVKNALNKFPRSLSGNRRDGEDLVFSSKLFLKRLEVVLRAVHVAFVTYDDLRTAGKLLAKFLKLS